MSNINNRMVFSNTRDGNPGHHYQDVLIDEVIVGTLCAKEINFLVPIEERFASISLSKSDAEYISNNIKQTTSIEESEDTGRYHVIMKLRESQQYLDLYQIANKVWKLIYLKFYVQKWQSNGYYPTECFERINGKWYHGLHKVHSGKDYFNMLSSNVDNDYIFYLLKHNSYCFSTTEIFSSRTLYKGDMTIDDIEKLIFNK